MITEPQLFKQGWRRYGDDENDPFYKLILDNSVFNLSGLAGNFREDGSFWIYSMNKKIFNDISEIQEVIDINGFKVAWYVVERYGSDKPIKKELNA